MKTLVKTSLALVASLVLLLGCSKQASTPASSTKEDTTTQSRRPNKAANNHLKRKMRQKPTHLFTIAIGRTSTLTYTVKGMML